VSEHIGISVRFFDLHRTFYALAVRRIVDVKTLSSMLVHCGTGFTLDTYTHVTGKMQLGAADKIGVFMDSAMPDKSGCKIIPFERVI
jgi:hypothetical protein